LPKSAAILVEDDQLPKPGTPFCVALYRPLDAKADWGIVLIGDGIAGVYSQSTVAPLKRANFPTRYAGFEPPLNTTSAIRICSATFGRTRSPRPRSPTSTPMIRSIEEKGLLMNVVS